MFSSTSRTWAEIDLKNIEHNYRTLKSLNKNTMCLGVVKANAYGHGAVKVASMLQDIGCDYLAVATAEEALELRNSGITIPVMILGFTPVEYAAAAAENDVTLSVGSLSAAKALSEAAQSCGKNIKAHLKLDSGMGRLGFSCLGTDDEDILSSISLPGLDFEGVFTHFAVSETDDSTYTLEQFRLFKDKVSFIEEKSGHTFKIKHCANSGATLKYPELALDMVRPGIALYGLDPGCGFGGIDLRPAMELKSKVFSVKRLPKGCSVSYGRTFTADEDRLIAVIPIGYADGLHRVLSNKLEVLIRGKRAKQVGNICMDMCMVDVTDIPGVSVGDTVTIFGRDGNEFIPVDDLAEKAGTISYEMLCGFTSRVPKTYK